MISRLIDTLRTLRKAGVELDAREIAEILWLAPFLDSGAAPAEPASTDDGSVEHRESPTQSGEAPPEEERPRASPPSPPTPDPSSSEADVVMPRSEPGVPTRSGGGKSFRSPGAPALPNALQLGRALRPLRKRRLSSSGQREIDERATAERIAREGLWSPVLRPGRSRWLDLELVIDTGRSMAIWERTLAELRSLLRYQGGFRDVRTWSLVTDGADGRARLYRGAVGGVHGAPERHPRELVGTSAERRLVLVVSDGVSPAWHTGDVDELLRLWGRSGPVSLLQMLPQRLWVRTALRHHPVVWVHGREPGAANARLMFGPWPGALISSRPGAIPLPAVTLEKDSFAGWARVLAGVADAWAPGVLLREGGSVPRAVPRQGVEPGAVLSQREMEPRERVERFDAMSSPLARRLARLFAAVPLSLPIMRLVWRTRLPEAMQVHLAEVFLSGLLVEVESPGGAVEPEKTQYDFVPGVREILLESVPPAESLDTLRSVSHYVEERLGQTLDFQAMLADPTAFGDEQVDETLKPFARVAATVLRQLGGEYAELAARLTGMPSGHEGRESRARTVPSRESPQGMVEARSEEPAEAPRWQASGKRVLVIGTGVKVHPELRRLCVLLGQGLARKGNTLVGGGEPGVEQEVGSAYVETLRALGGDPQEHFIQVMSSGRAPVLNVGRVELSKGGRRRITAALGHADIIVMLQGEAGTFQVFEAARSSYKPILPLPGTGGDAARAYKIMLGDLAYRWRSGLSRRSLLRLEGPVSTPGQAEHAVAELLMLGERLQTGADLAPYAGAMLDLFQALEFAHGHSGELVRRRGWNTFMGELARAAGMKRLEPRPLARMVLEPGGSASVKLGDLTPAINALRATLPGMRERLLEDFERINKLEYYELFGYSVQMAIAPLVLEFAGREALDAVGEVIQQASAPRESPFIVSLVDAARTRFDSPAQYEAWLSSWAGISSKELEFRRVFLDVAERLSEEYGKVRGRSFKEVDAALLAIVRESRLISIWHAASPVSDAENVHAYSHDEVARIESSDALDALVTPPDPRFVRHFLSSRWSPQRATAYLLIQQYVPELFSELERALANERVLLREGADEWTFAVNRLFACILHLNDELLRGGSWLGIQKALSQLLDDLRKNSIPGEEVALKQLVEQLSENTKHRELQAQDAPLLDASRVYARAMLLFLASEQPRLFSDKKRSSRPKWNTFLKQLARQAQVKLPRTDDTFSFVVALMTTDMSEAEVPDVSRAKEIARARIQTTFPWMGYQFLKDFEGISSLEADGSFVFEVQTALAPLVVQLDETSELGATGRLLHRVFNAMPSPLMPSPLVTNLLDVARGRFRSEEEYRAWVAHRLGISLQEYEFRQTVHRLSVALMLNLEVTGGRIAQAMDNLREALPSNDVARDPAFIRFFLEETRPAQERALAYLLIEEFGLGSLLTEVISALPREHRTLKEPACRMAVWQLLSCLNAFQGEPLLEDQWSKVSPELGAILLKVGRHAELDPHGEVAEIAKLLVENVSGSEAREQWLRLISEGDDLGSRGDRLGALMAYQESLIVAERVAGRDPGAWRWQVNQAISHGKMGCELFAQGNYLGALESHKASLTIAQRFDRFYPEDAVWLGEISVCQEKLGDMLRTEGKHSGALAAYRVALALRRCLVRLNPGSADVQRELSRSHEKVEELLRELEKSSS